MEERHGVVHARGVLLRAEQDPADGGVRVLGRVEQHLGLWVGRWGWDWLDVEGIRWCVGDALVRVRCSFGLDRLTLSAGSASIVTWPPAPIVVWLAVLCVCVTVVVWRWGERGAVESRCVAGVDGRMHEASPARRLRSISDDGGALACLPDPSCGCVLINRTSEPRTDAALPTRT